MRFYTFIGLALLLLGALYFVVKNDNVVKKDNSVELSNKQILIAHLTDNDREGMTAIQKAFRETNPGYDLSFAFQTKELQPEERNRVAFVQTGGGTATLTSGDRSKVSIGDIVLLDPDVGLEADSLLDFLVFSTPEIFPGSLPRFIRPDWDENITDIPGGCATETGAYRRILLTWLGKVGPYLYHSLNAHRVRIMDSFTHYHPEEGGFDEFYLVQMAMPGARLITGTRPDLVENYENLTAAEASQLLTYNDLQVGDLIYLPRGTIHRGIGGVLAQIITVPGFIPKSEIGVDYHLRRINEHFDLRGEAALPYHEAASEEVVIK
jgi:hypothetical protein